ncbi:MAG: hypothetical protein NTY38_12885 [Acidobacteria bacterium]|nr:hypothetical protein [Acidobacteriota bacterium]
MNSEEFARLGRQERARNPKKYKGYTDEEVGEAWVNMNRPGRGFSLFQGVQDWITGRAVDHQRQEMEWQRVADEAMNLPQTLARKHEREDYEHEAIQLHSQNTRQAIESATGRNLTVGSWEAVRVTEETSRIELEKRAAEIRMDIEAALTVSMIDQQKAVHIQDQMLKLIEKANEISRSGKPQEVIEAQLEVIREVLAGFRTDLQACLKRPGEKFLSE